MNRSKSHLILLPTPFYLGELFLKKTIMNQIMPQINMEFYLLEDFSFLFLLKRVSMTMETCLMK